MPYRRHLLMLSLLTLCGAPPVAAQQPIDQGEPNVPEFEPAFEGQTRAPASDSGITLAAERLAGPLEHPWGIDVLPDGGYLVTERPGRLRVISAEGELSQPVTGMPEVVSEGQGGLLDVRVGPTFAEDRLIYWTYARPLEGGRSGTAAARGRLSEDGSEVTNVQDIFVQEPPSPVTNHYGSRILFDGEGHAFITTGEHFNDDQRVLSQDLGSTYGKVVRVSLDGSIPEDNPFAGVERAVESIWTLGHRNIQGAALHPRTGRLWVIEHGPQGGDELNLIERGANYGWPLVSYGEDYDNSPVGEGVSRHGGSLTEPRYYWDPVIAPGGALFYEGEMFPEWQGDLLISSMKPGGIVRIELEGDSVSGEERLLANHGRIRDLVVAPDGALLALVDAVEGSVLRLAPDGNARAAWDPPEEVWRARGFQRPESAVLDAERNALYVSNVGASGGEQKGQGYISKLTPDGEVTDARWVTGLNAPKGMALRGGRLYVSDVNRLVAIDVAAGEIAETWGAPNAKSLNDVTVDSGGRVFVSDMRGNAIYVLDGEEFSLWLEDEALMQPNGLLAEEERLVVAPWGKGEGGDGHLMIVAYEAKTIEILGDGTPVGNLDGLESAGDGSYLVTDWVSGALFRIQPTGAANRLLDLGQGSADLEYRDGIALVPMMVNGELRAFRID